MARTRTFLDAFLDDNPDIAFEALRPQSASRSFTDYFRGQFGSTYGDYLGGIGREALAGNEPTEEFVDFLGVQPWEAFYQGLSPTARGDRPSLLAPRTNFNFRR